MDFAAIFKSAGVPYVEVGPWRSHVRPGTFKPEGVMIHHTGSTGFASTLKVVRYGREDLAGPLCNIYVANGKCYIISAGKANHAGEGSSVVLKEMRQGILPSTTAAKRGLANDYEGANALFVGFEILAKGDNTPIPERDWEVAAKASAACLRYLAYRKEIPSAHRARVIGHAEWTARKIDPKLGRGRDAWTNMARFRQKLETWL